MKLLVINGPNINMLGIRERDLYGTTTYREMVAKLKKKYREMAVTAHFFQSNEEGKIVGRIQKAIGKYDGIIINAAAYTHTSIAILDALKSVAIPCVEVHITDTDAREEFRRVSFISQYAFAVIKGEGIAGYVTAAQKLAERLSQNA